MPCKIVRPGGLFYKEYFFSEQSSAVNLKEHNSEFKPQPLKEFHIYVYEVSHQIFKIK
jgi:hypothetical protein